ncbi:hypothetical protein D3C73_1558470 [compost metagenome]
MIRRMARNFPLPKLEIIMDTTFRPRVMLGITHKMTPSPSSSPTIIINVTIWMDLS